jgi:hypothetical protein
MFLRYSAEYDAYNFAKGHVLCASKRRIRSKERVKIQRHEPWCQAKCSPEEVKKSGGAAAYEPALSFTLCGKWLYRQFRRGFFKWENVYRIYPIS